MDASTSERSVYRFAAIGARGTITLMKDSVHVKTRTFQGWWEQTIPLEHLSPLNATLTTTPPMYTLAWVLAILFLYAGIYVSVTSTAVFPRTLLGVFLLLFGAFFMWYLYRHRKTEWTTFPARGGGRGICYTRQGPDAESCDEFTRRVAMAIRSTPSAE